MSPTIRMNCHLILTNWCPHLCHLHHFTPDAPPCTNLPIYPGLGQAPNVLDCIPGGLVNVSCVILIILIPLWISIRNWHYDLARTLSKLITVADISMTLVSLSARHVTFTWHTAWEQIVAERTLVTTTASIFLYTTTLTTDDITLTGWWANFVACTWLKPQIITVQYQ